MTSARDDTREGKGRVRPGPSPSAPARSRLQGRRGRPATGWITALGFTVVLVAVAASSVLGTQVHSSSSPAALALLAAAGAALGVLVGTGLPALRARSSAEWLLPLVAGAAGFGFAPWLVMANRYTDAPPGSEVLFFTTASWGALLAVTLALTSRQRISRLGGAVLALAGAAVLVANWERPSSFSPFVRFPAEAVAMLVAGALWAGLVLVLLAAARRQALTSAAWYAALGGLVCAGVLAGVAAGDGVLLARHFSQPGAWGYGIAVGFATAGTLMVVRSGRAEAVAGAYLLVPSAVSLLLFVMEATRVYGPRPILVGPAAAAVICTVAGVLVTRGAGASRRDGGGRSGGPIVSVARAVGALAVMASVAALASPALTATVTGLRTDGAQYRASFDLFGYEVAGPWIAAGVAVAGLGMALDARGLRESWVRVLALAGAAGVWVTVADTPLRTLASFIPSDVQVDYGSEYARIVFAGAPSALAAAALSSAVVAAALPWVTRSSTPADGAGAGADQEVGSGG